MIDYAWVTATEAVLNQERVRIRTATGFGAGFADPSASLAVLNWNDDGHADLALVSASPQFIAQGFISLGRGALERARRPDQPLDRHRPRGHRGGRLRPHRRGERPARRAGVRAGPGLQRAAPMCARWPPATSPATGSTTCCSPTRAISISRATRVSPTSAGLTCSPAGPRRRPTTWSGRCHADVLAFWGGVRGELVVQDFSLGGEHLGARRPQLRRLRRLRGRRSREGRRAGDRDATRDGGLFVYFGQADFGGAPRARRTAADIVVRRMAAARSPKASRFEGALHATGGDFNGDGRMDLAVGEPSRELKATGSTTIARQRPARHAVDVLLGRRQGRRPAADRRRRRCCAASSSSTASARCPRRRRSTSTRRPPRPGGRRAPAPT